jgi:hypothetical protein
VLLSANFLFFAKDFQKNQSSTHWYTIRNNKSAQNADDMFSALFAAPLRGWGGPQVILAKREAT